MMGEDLNLSGIWKGIFNYPRLLPPNHFEAELRDQLGVLTGETFERGNGFRNKGQPLPAMLEGQRHGFSVTFVKRYDEFKRVSTPVHYTGTVRGDGNEISGTWEIPGQWSGTFLMIRAKPKSIGVERKIEVTVD
jgi:hypothetical protein